MSGLSACPQQVPLQSPVIRVIRTNPQLIHYGNALGKSPTRYGDNSQTYQLPMIVVIH